MSCYRSFMASMMAIGLASTVYGAESAPPIIKNTSNPSNITSSSSIQKININTASINELAKVKGLSKVKAKNIFSYRKKHGEFKSMADLKLIKGFKKIPEEKMKIIQEQLVMS